MMDIFYKMYTFWIDKKLRKYEDCESNFVTKKTVVQSVF